MNYNRHVWILKNCLFLKSLSLSLSKSILHTIHQSALPLSKHPLADLPFKWRISDVVRQFGFASLLNSVRLDTSLVLNLQTSFGSGGQHFAINWITSTGALISLIRLVAMIR